METVHLTLEQARALRLVALGLAPDAPGAPRLTSPAEVAAHHLAMQGQDFGAVQWAVASRLLSADPHSRDVLAAFDAGEIVRTWPMRGTVHLLAAPDSRWLLDLCGPVALRGARRRQEHLGIDQDFVDTVLDVTARTLAAGGSASRDELVVAYGDAGLDFSEGQRRYHSIWYACQVGLAMLGPTRGGDNLVVLAEEHVPDALRCPPEEALTMLGRRYLTARAPASLEDLQHWTKLTKTQCRAALAAVGEDLVGVEIEGYDGPALVALADQVASVQELAFGEGVPRALALAGFDEHLLGFKDRSLVLDPDKARYVDPGRNGVFRHTVLMDGRVVGTWRKRLLASRAPVEVALFEPTTAAERRLITAAFDPWGRYVEREPEVSFSDG